MTLIAPLSGARARGFGLGVVAAPPPAGESGWRPAGAAGLDPDRLAASLARAAASAGTKSRAVAATWIVEKHAWYVSGVALGAALLHGAIPPLDAAQLRYGPSGWAEAIAVPPDGWEAVGSGAELAARLEAHLAPLVYALGRHRTVRALWRSAGDRLCQAALWCGEALDDPCGACCLAEEALAAPTAMQAPACFAVVDGERFRRRCGCCLSHRCPGGVVCPDCPLGR